ncbi:hypothetical protein ACFQH8_08850 [Halomicroarcula sp. GCM10025710]
MGVVRDISDRRQLEQTLAALHDATRYLLQAKTKSEVAEHIVGTATDVLDLPAASMYLFHPGENVLRQTALSGASDGDRTRARLVTPDSGLIWDAFVDNEQISFGTGTERPSAMGYRRPSGRVSRSRSTTTASSSSGPTRNSNRVSARWSNSSPPAPRPHWRGSTAR